MSRGKKSSKVHPAMARILRSRPGNFMRWMLRHMNQAMRPEKRMPRICAMRSAPMCAGSTTRFAPACSSFRSVEGTSPRAMI